MLKLIRFSKESRLMLLAAYLKTSIAGGVMRSIYLTCLIFLGAIFLLSSCSMRRGTEAPSDSRADLAGPADRSSGRVLGRGEASFYETGFQGQKTASGEKYDGEQLTAAHRTLPFNSKVKVTNIENGKSVFVRINDRGPFAQNRIIDLSAAAARQLNFVEDGVADVELELIESHTAKTPGSMVKSSGAERAISRDSRP